MSGNTASKERGEVPIAARVAQRQQALEPRKMGRGRVLAKRLGQHAIEQGLGQNLRGLALGQGDHLRQHGNRQLRQIIALTAQQTQMGEVGWGVGIVGAKLQRLAVVMLGFVVVVALACQKLAKLPV